MKATIERATLLKSLGHVQSVVERRNTIPILSNVLIEASADGTIRLMATDLDLQINESVEAQVETPGATTVSAHTLFDIARKLPEGSQVSLAAAEGKMAVNAGRARFNLQTLPRDDFPVIAEGELPTKFELPAATLKEIIDKTRFAISTEETRYYHDKILRIDPKSFMEGVDRVSTIASEKTRAVKMALETDKITLSVTSPENGTAAEEVSGEYKSDGFEIGFNARYLMDILAQVEGDAVEVHLADAAAPTLIRENDKASALYVLMPMRV